MSGSNLRRRAEGAPRPRLDNLPAELDSFIGRAQELRAVRELLDEHRLVALTGPGGSGKTRLARRAAADRLARHADGVWLVELAALGDNAAVAGAVAAVLGAGPEPTELSVAELADRVARHDALLVLDDCEHLLGGVAPLVEGLLRACPRLRVLVTTRQPLDVRGEVTWRVPPMALPGEGGADAGDIDALWRYDAVALFVDRARRGRPDLVLDEGDADGVLRICRRLDGMPLAIELAAARVRQMGISQVERGLEDRFGLLRTSGSAGLPRQAALAASVDWSHDLLEEDERVGFRRLAVFRGAFTVEAACAVLGEVPTSTLPAALADRSLLQLEVRGGETRYRSLETVRAYALGKLEASGELGAMCDRHLAHHVELAERAGPALESWADRSWLDQLDRSQGDLRAALRWAAESGDGDSLARLVAALCPHWHARGQSSAVQAWYERAITSAHDPVLRARAAWASAYLAYYANDLTLAASRAGLALELAEAHVDGRTAARACDTIGSIQQFGDPLGADPMFARAVSLARSAGDAWCELDALQKLSFSSVYRDRWPEALDVAAQVDALICSGSVGNPFFVAWSRFLRAEHALRTGDLHAGIAALDAGIAAADEVGEPMTVGCVGTMLGLLRLLGGDDAGADEALAATVDRLGEGDHGLGDAMVATVSGVVALHRGDPAAAVALLAGVHRELVGMGIAFPTSFFAPFLALAHADAGDADAARDVVVELEAIDGVLRSRHVPHAVELLRARIARLEGRPDLAEPHARAAVAGFVEEGFWPDASTALELLGGTIAELGNRNDGVRLLAAAAAARTTRGWRSRWSAGLDQLVERDAASARAGSGPDRFDTAWAEGSALELAAAARLAARARGTRRRPSTGWASLTPTELEVVEHVAEGRTNPEIAERLLMSRATVKTHVSHVLAKLGLRTRAEIAAEVARRRSR